MILDLSKNSREFKLQELLDSAQCGLCEQVLTFFDYNENKEPRLVAECCGRTYELQPSKVKLTIY